MSLEDRPAGALYCLIGRSVSASPSPAMMNAAFSKLKMNARYVAMSIQENELAKGFDELKRRKNFRGMNVTIPFKSSIIPLLDGLDRLAAKIQAVNVVKRIGRRFIGYNTDVDGVVQPLRRLCGGRVESAAVIGAGGAARALVGAVSEFHCRNLLVLVREKSRAMPFIGDMRANFPKIHTQLRDIDEPLGASRLDLLFNASPIGTLGIPLPKPLRELARNSSIVFDAVYRPMDTELLRVAKRAGAKVVYGYEMLLHQGIGAFELWTAMKAPREVMRHALLNFLGAEAD